MSEPSNVARFTGNTENAREHISISVELLARKMAEVHEVGYRSGLSDGRVSDMESARLLSRHSLSFEVRVNLYIAMWDALIAAGDPIAVAERSA